MMNANPKILAICPTWRLEPETADYLLSLKNNSIHIVFTKDFPTSKDKLDVLHAYQQTRKLFLSNDYDYLYIVESDQIPPVDALEKLLKSMDTYDIVIGLYMFRRTSRASINATRLIEKQSLQPDTSWTEYPEDFKKLFGKVIPVTGSGIGCCLIKRKVIEQIEWRGTEITPHCDWQFLTDSLAAGYKWGCDTSVLCGHKKPDGTILYPNELGQEIETEGQIFYDYHCEEAKKVCTLEYAKKQERLKHKATEIEVDAKDITVITAISNGYDRLLKQRKELTRKYKFIAYVDDCTTDYHEWEKRDIYNKCIDPCRNAKIHKICAHQYVDTSYSIWMDGTMELKDIKLEVIINKYLVDADIAILKHRSRNDIYQEYHECMTGHDKPETLTKQIEAYKDYPVNYGLYECGLLIRRHTKEMNNFCNEWYAHINKYSRRDQISFAYLAWKMNLKINIIEGLMNNNEIVTVIKHVKPKAIY